MNVKTPRYGRFLDELAPGMVLDHPRRLTLTANLIEEFAGTFMDYGYLGSEVAPPQLVFNVIVSLGVQNNSEQVLANLGYENAVFHQDVRAGDTLRATTTIVNKRDRGEDKPGVVRMNTTGFNQRDEVVLTYERAILVPRGSAPAPTPPRFETFAVGDVILHSRGRTITDEHMAWTTRLGNTHPLHFDRVFATEPMVYGGLVFAWLVGLTSRDISEGVATEIAFTAGAHTQPVHAGDTLYAISKVIAKDEAERTITFRLVGVKNIAPAEALDRLGPTLFENERKTPEKVFLVTRTLHFV